MAGSNSIRQFMNIVESTGYNHIQSLNEKESWAGNIKDAVLGKTGSMVKGPLGDWVKTRLGSEEALGRTQRRLVRNFLKNRWIRYRAATDAEQSIARLVQFLIKFGYTPEDFDAILKQSGLAVELPQEVIQKQIAQDNEDDEDDSDSPEDPNDDDHDEVPVFDDGPSENNQPSKSHNVVNNNPKNKPNDNTGKHSDENDHTAKDADDKLDTQEKEPKDTDADVEEPNKDTGTNKPVKPKKPRRTGIRNPDKLKSLKAKKTSDDNVFNDDGEKKSKTDDKKSDTTESKLYHQNDFLLEIASLASRKQKFDLLGALTWASRKMLETNILPSLGVKAIFYEVDDQPYWRVFNNTLHEDNQTKPDTPDQKDSSELEDDDNDDQHDKPDDSPEDKSVRHGYDWDEILPDEKALQILDLAAIQALAMGYVEFPHPDDDDVRIGSKDLRGTAGNIRSKNSPPVDHHGGGIVSTDSDPSQPIEYRYCKQWHQNGSAPLPKEKLQRLIERAQRIHSIENFRRDVDWTKLHEIESDPRKQQLAVDMAKVAYGVMKHYPRIGIFKNFPEDFKKFGLDYGDKVNELITLARNRSFDRAIRERPTDQQQKGPPGGVIWSHVALYASAAFIYANKLRWEFSDPKDDDQDDVKNPNDDKQAS